ncbi:MAG TPA: hypothetical protein VLJ10_01510 [Candidatus Bathyarchaeia archaeon]|nr:hypothetical protein [Candidatus Bathyarchaeia archaeon]
MLYLFQIPMRTPWEFKGPAPVAIWKALLSGWMEIVPLFFALTLYTIYKVRRSHGIRHLFTQSAWPLFFMIAVFMIPTSLLGRVKIGGAINCLSPTSFFLATAFSLVLKDLFLSAFHDGKHNGKSFMKLIFTIFPVMLIVLFLPEFKTIKAEVDGGLWQNEQQLAYHMMKQHPGQIYAPSLPLASLLADGKLYHHDYGVFDRCFNTKFNVSQNHFRRHIPADMRWVILTDPIVWACHVKFYPEFNQEVQMPGAPGKVFTKKDAGAAFP